jgi:hypothetical protein
MSQLLTLNIGFPEAIYLALTFLGLGLILAKDGQPKEGTYSFPITLCSIILVIVLLWWGGFFS